MGRTTTPAAAKAAAGSPTPRRLPTAAKPKTVTVAGVTVTLPTVLPAGFLWIISRVDDPSELGPRQLIEIIEMLVTPEDLEQIKTKLPVHEIGPLVEALLEAAEATDAPGEPQASPAT